MNISVIGLGKLGTPYAAVLAAAGHMVIGVDQDEAKVNAINAGTSPIREPRVEQLIAESNGRLTAMVDTKDAVTETDVTFIVVPTPSDSEGKFKNESVLHAARLAGLAIRAKRDPHVVVVTSTVQPGSMTGPIKATLEQTSGRRVGSDLGLCYSPEFIALGSVVDDMLTPDMVLIGESDFAAGAVVDAVYRSYLQNTPEFHRMSLGSAEIAKIALNTYVTMKISFANLIGEVCDSMPGTDAIRICDAIGADQRVGKKYLHPAGPFGGPCFPRDTRAFGTMLNQAKIPSRLPETIDKINRDQLERIIELIDDQLGDNDSVGVLGLSYKPRSDVVEEALGFKIATHYADTGAVNVYDPLVTSHPDLDNANWCETPHGVLSSSDVTIICNPDPAFESVRQWITSKVTVIDVWRIFENHPHTIKLGVSVK